MQEGSGQDRCAGCQQGHAPEAPGAEEINDQWSASNIVGGAPVQRIVTNSRQQQKTSLVHCGAVCCGASHGVRARLPLHSRRHCSLQAALRAGRAVQVAVARAERRLRVFGDLRAWPDRGEPFQQQLAHESP